MRNEYLEKKTRGEEVEEVVEEDGDVEEAMKMR